MSKSTVVIFFRDNPGNNQSAIRGAKNTDTSPLKHQIFYYYSKIAEYLQESKWVSFFDCLSKGSSYKNLKFDGTSLICKLKGSKVIKYDIVVSQTMNIVHDLQFDIVGYRECQKFIESNTVFFIENDTRKEYLQSEHLQEQIISLHPQIEISGALSSSLNSQMAFIGEFTCRRCRELGLSEVIRKALFSSIFVKLSCKELTSKSFNILPNGTIDSIDGVIIDKNGFYFTPVKPKATRATKTSALTTDPIYPINKTTAWPSQRVIRWFD